MGKVHVFIVFKLMTSSEFLYSRNYQNRKTNLKKLGWSMESGPWKGSIGWSMDWGSVFSTLPLSSRLGDFWSLELLPEQPCSVHNSLFQWMFFSKQASVARVDVDFRVLFCQRNIKHKTRKLGRIHAVCLA